METKQTRNLCKPEGYKEPKIDATKSMKNQDVNHQQGDMNVGYDVNPKFSPDGKYIAWQSMAHNGYESDRNRLCVYNLATGEKKYVTESFDSNVDDYCWSDTKDAQIYFIGVWHATENLYAVTRKGEVKQLTVQDSHSGKTGSYTMSFIGFSEQPTFNDDFDTLDTDVWKQCRDNDGNLYKSGTVSDGKLIFTIEKEGEPRCLLSTEGSFSQAYGCFSAVMEMPKIGSGNATS